MKESSSPLVLRNRNFLLLWLGQTLSQGGTRMYQIAIVWWILGQAGTREDPQFGPGVLLGLFLVVCAVPALVLVKQVGRVVERHSSQVVLVRCDFLACFLTALVYGGFRGGGIGLEMVYVAGFGLAVVEAFFNPSLSKAIPELVAVEEIEEAVAFSSSSQYLASFSGAVAGAVLISWVGIPGVVLLNSLSFLVSGFCTLAIRFRTPAPSPRKGGEEMAAGWGVLEEYPLLRQILVGFGVVNFFATPTLVILPLYTRLTLQGGVRLLGVLEAALWGGLLAGTFLASRVTSSRGVIRLGAICLLILGLMLFLPGVIVSRYAYPPLLFLAGTALGVNNVKFLSLFQKVVMPGLKGRFFALLHAMASFTFPVAYFLFGLLGDTLSPPVVCLIQGAGVMALSLYFWELGAREEEINP